MKRLACLLLILATGCATLPPGDIEALPPRVSTDGYQTIVDGEALEMDEARDFYRQAGVPEALTHFELGAATYREAKGRFYRDAFIGLLVAGMGGYVIGSQQSGQPYGYESTVAAISAGGGLLAGAVFGLFDSTSAKRAALPELRAAARTYNQAFANGRPVASAEPSAASGVTVSAAAPGTPRGWQPPLAVRVHYDDSCRDWKLRNLGFPLELDYGLCDSARSEAGRAVPRQVAALYDADSGEAEHFDLDPLCACLEQPSFETPQLKLGSRGPELHFRCSGRYGKQILREELIFDAVSVKRLGGTRVCP